MKNLYPKGKGKIHPTPSSPSSVLHQLLPAAILALVSALSAEEAEVLAYLIFHSIKTDHPPASILQHSSKKCKKPPFFDCICFDCYTSFWTRWDSSPNRDLIHQAIEAFEEHLSSSSSPSSSKRTQKSKRSHRRESAGKQHAIPAIADLGSAETAASDNGSESDSRVSDVSGDVSEIEGVSAEQADMSDEVTGNLLEAVASVPVVRESSSERGLVKKVWPDVLGLFNSRLWSLWNPGP